MGEDTVGVVDHWLTGIRDLWEARQEELMAIADLDERARRLCELNVLDQVRALGRTTVVKDAWRRGQPVEVHGWIYGVEDGLLRNLGTRVGSFEERDAFEASL